MGEQRPGRKTESIEKDSDTMKDQCDGKAIMHTMNKVIQCNDKKGERKEEARRSSAEEAAERELMKLHEMSHPVLVFDYKSQQSGMNAPTISALGSYQGWQEIEVTVDSGACDTVMPLSLCSDIPRHESEQQRSGMEYEVANGACIRNEGERRCLMMTNCASGPKRIVSQVADVHKALLSISPIADAGYECHLGAHGGCLLDVHTGETIPIARKGNLYVMKAWIKDDQEDTPAQGFARQG